MRIFPKKSWWFTPSGGPYKKPWSLWTILTEAPLPSHLLGAILLVPMGLPFILPIPLWVKFWWGCVCAMVGHQAVNVERLGFAAYPIPQMVWRVLIGAIPLGGVLWLLN